MKKFFCNLWAAIARFLADKESEHQQGRAWVISAIINREYTIEQIRELIEDASFGGYVHEFELGACEVLDDLQGLFDPARRRWRSTSEGITLRQHVLGRRSIAPDVYVVVYPILTQGEVVWVLAHNDEISPLRIDEYIPILELI